jgi:hypothetical protein
VADQTEVFSLLLRLRLRPAGRRPPARVVRAKQTLLATALAAVMLVPPAWVVVETARPDCLDPTYVQTRTALAAAVAAHPDHRLAVVIGSSRTQIGFAPELLPPQTDAVGRPVLWFNASHYEAGPGMNFVTLSRLLRDGHVPATVVMEIMPAFCAHGAAGLLAKHATYRDAAAALTADLPGDLIVTVLKRRLTHFHDLESAWTGSGEPPLASGPYGNAPAPAAVPPAERSRRRSAQLAWLNYLLELPSIHPATVRATAATVAACRERGIDLVFVLTPESPAFRAAYDPAGLARFSAWVAGTSREYGVKVIDARDWLPEEQFVDGHHATAEGAASFTARLVRELGPVRQPTSRCRID